MYVVYYKKDFEPANELSFRDLEGAEKFAKRVRGRGWDVTILRK